MVLFFSGITSGKSGAIISGALAQFPLDTSWVLLKLTENLRKTRDNYFLFNFYTYKDVYRQIMNNLYLNWTKSTPVDQSICYPNNQNPAPYQLRILIIFHRKYLFSSSTGCYSFSKSAVLLWWSHRDVVGYFKTLEKQWYVISGVQDKN